MKILGRMINALPLLGALLLVSCGGGNGGATLTDHQSTPGVAVGEPNGGVPQTDEFIKLARGADCSTTTNRLYVIDQKMVFWNRADLHCYDASYGRTLYGATSQQVLCSNADSIAGPRTSCTDSQYRALFDTILNNLDLPDLGLGSGHKVEPIALLAVAGSSLAFQPVASDADSGVKTASNVIIKDAASWARVWAEHNAGRSPVPALPALDFSKQMLVGVFSGEHPNGCRAVDITRIGMASTGIVVEYSDHDLMTVAVCGAATSAGMDVVALDRSDLPVQFVNTTTAAVDFATIDSTTRSNITRPRSVTIKDAASWSALWAEHSGGATAAPAIDFSKEMVLGVFIGTSPNGCYATAFTSVYRVNHTITAVHTDSVPGMGVFCTMSVTAPAHLVRVARSDDPVEFASLSKPVR